MQWNQLTHEEMNGRIEEALNENTSYKDEMVFGIPGSFLNPKVFPYKEFLKDAPFLKTMLENPNHIGCHTMGTSESFFKGTHKIEKEVIDILATDLMKAKPDSYDGYIASGGTEGNIQGLWIIRNFYQNHFKAKLEEIEILFSEDTHYSSWKGCHLLGLEGVSVPVARNSRQLDLNWLRSHLEKAQARGVKYLGLMVNMGTTMFGSVDDIQPLIKLLKEYNFQYKLHIDAAFGGFIYPFANENSKLSFQEESIISVSLDAHKMLMAPYGTGIFICKRPYLNEVATDKASYVQGFDQTLVGSRSGASAISVWMILHAYGKNGWSEFIEGILKKTDLFCSLLKEKKIEFFRDPFMNVVTIKEGALPKELVQKYHLVPDKQQDPQWVKAVIMDHVTEEKILNFKEDFS